MSEKTHTQENWEKRAREINSEIEICECIPSEDFECSACGRMIEIITKALTQAHASGREAGLEEALKYHAERITHFQDCINKAKANMEKDGQSFHQQHIWEFQAMRDEHVQAANVLRNLSGRKAEK